VNSLLNGTGNYFDGAGNLGTRAGNLSARIKIIAGLDFPNRGPPGDVRFTSKRGHVRRNVGCPLWANSGQRENREFDGPESKNANDRTLARPAVAEAS